MFTTVIAVDEQTIKQLRVSWPTWQRHRRDILSNPMLIIYDREQVTPDDLSFVKHDNVTYYGWPPGGDFDTQREKMLSAFVHVPPWEVATQWWLKVDCDALAHNSDPWIDPRWFDKSPEKPESFNSFIGSSWGYTKPANQMSLLDLWAAMVPGLSNHVALDLPYDPESGTLRHTRLASWICFFNTEWSRSASEYADFPTIPVPSEDGYHFYVAERRGDPYLLTNFKRRGWSNHSRIAKLREAAERIMGR
jgi:hypothetical protein